MRQNRQYSSLYRSDVDRFANHESTALHRLEQQGWISAEWGASDNNRRAKYYELTRSGRNQLRLEADAWQTLTTAVSLVLDMG